MITGVSCNSLTRLSGFFYLLVVLTGIFSLMYVPSQFVQWDDPAQTLAQLNSKRFLFRLGILSSLLCYTFFLFLGWSLYALLQEVHKPVAIIMLSLVLCSVPVAVFSAHYLIHMLSLLEETRYAVGELEPLVMNALLAYSDGLFTASLFWSTWLFPFGYLVYRADFLPRWLGILLMVGSACYILYFAGTLLFPESPVVGYLRRPASVAEIVTCLWLLIAGSRN